MDFRDLEETSEYIGDGFFYDRLIHNENDEELRQRALEIVGLIIQGKRQCEIGELELNSVEASERYSQFITYLYEKGLEDRKYEVLFNLQNFEGDYLDFWKWLLNRTQIKISKSLNIH